MINRLSLTILIACAAVLSSCGKKNDTTSTTTTDIEETGQQVGDVMASIDESGGSNSGTYSLNQDVKPLLRVCPNSEPLFAKLFLPKADATSCFLASTFGSCGSGTLVRTFSGCTVGSVTFDGTVTFSFSDSTCHMNTTGQTVSRNPDFTITGRRGGTLTVSKTGTYGQRVTKTSAGFNFDNDGIRRVITVSGSTKYDFTTQTTSAIAITGTSRSDRVLNGGSLRVTNNLTSVTCDYVPSNVSWTSTCNCASSGTWTGTCSDSTTTTLEITACGSANLTIGSQSQSLSFDRCSGT